MPYKDPEKRKEYLREYYQKNADAIVERVTRRYQEKKAEILIYHKEFYLKNREKLLADCKVYRTENNAKYRAAIDRWTENHREEYTAWKKQWQKDWSKRNRASIYARDVQRREWKRESVDETTDFEAIKQFYILAGELTITTGTEYVVDHIQPIVKGGRHHQDNLQVITKGDNLKKGAKYPFEITEKHFPDELYFNPSPDYITHT